MGPTWNQPKMVGKWKQQTKRWLESGIVRRNKNIDSWPNLELTVESQDNDNFNDKKLN